MTELVQQRHQNDCFLCCLAMACATTYEAASEKWGDDFVSRIGRDGLYGKSDIDTAFAALGLQRDVHFRAYLCPGAFATGELGAEFAVVPTTAKLKQLIWGRRALVQVKSKNFEGKSHMLYWDGRAVFDPSRLKTFAWDEVDPEHVWLFQEGV